MQRLEVSGAVLPIYASLGIKWLFRKRKTIFHVKATVFLKNTGVSVAVTGGSISIRLMVCSVTNSI